MGFSFLSASLASVAPVVTAATFVGNGTWIISGSKASKALTVRIDATKASAKRRNSTSAEAFEVLIAAVTAFKTLAIPPELV